VSGAVHYLAAGIEQSWRVAPGGLVAGETPDGATVVVVVDYADETQLLVSVPCVRGGDGRRLRRRRLEREFPGVALRTVVPVQDRARDGESDIVLLAVGAGDALNEALLTLGQRQALQAVTTPALLAAAWVRAAKLSKRRLLIAMPTPAGLRLVFVDRGQPLLTRLTSPIESGETPVELARTIQYLQNTQRIERGEPVELWLWGVDDEDVDRCLPTGVPFQLGTPPRIAGLPDPDGHGFDALLEFAARGVAGPQLGTDAMRQGWHARQLRQVASRAAAALFAAALLSAGAVMWRTHGVARDAAASRNQNMTIAANHAALENDLAQRGIDLEDVRLLPDAEHALRDTEVDLAEVFGVVGHAFGRRQDIKLQSLLFFSAPPATPAERVDRSCGTEPLPPIATVEVNFTLDDDLDVRRRAESLAFVRRELTQLRPWRSTQATGVVGEHEPLTVKSRGEASGSASEWTACLLRGSES
jgi:hypothetical protein